MDGQQEQQCSQDMRELARQYADGRFNKAEYRSRRRDLIIKCAGEAGIGGDDTQDMPTLKTRALKLKIADPSLRANHLARVIGGVSLAAIAVLGYVIYRLHG